MTSSACRFAPDNHFFEVGKTWYLVSGRRGESFRLTGEQADAARTLRSAVVAGGDTVNCIEEIADLLSSEPGKAGSCRSVQTRPDNLRASASHEICAIDLHVTNDCNFRCKYCYGLSGEGYVNRPVYMTKDVADRVVDYVRRHGTKRLPVTIIFFGGEPLLNLPIMRHFVDRFADLEHPRVQYSITTNASLIDDDALALFIETNMRVMVSLDGPSNIHDRCRVFKHGRGTYASVSSGVERLIRSGKIHVTTRATVSKYNQGIVDLVVHAGALGAHQIAVSYMSAADQVVAPEDIASAKTRYLELVDYLLGECSQRRLRMPLPFSRILDDLFFMEDRPYPCSAGRNHLAIGPDGLIYPCHRYMDNKAFCLGSVSDAVDTEIAEKFWRNRADLKPSCRDCWARKMCRGGCPNDQVYDGDVGFMPGAGCGVQMAQIEAAIHFGFELQERYPDLLAKWVASRQRAFSADTC